MTTTDSAAPKKITSANLRAHFMSDEVRSCVNAYLIARAHAETMRKAVDEIEHQILEELPIYDTKRPGGRRLYRGDDLYLTDDAEACAGFYAEANRRERASKLKPANMGDEYCPALVAENLQRDAERLLIDTTGEPFGVTHEKVWCAADAAQNSKAWIDSVVGFIVRQPGYISPLEPSPR